MASATALQHEARTLILDALAWLRSSYPQHGFYVERDLVWTLQKWLDREITARALGLRVLNDYGVEPGPRRSLSGDLVLLPVDSPTPLLVAEFKFEPSHERGDIDPKKLPVVGWHGVVKDVDRIRRWVESGLTAEGLAVFVDEGGYRHARRPALDDSTWEHWGRYGQEVLDVWVHAFTRYQLSEAQTP
jgi:hypothetical protein